MLKLRNFIENVRLVFTSSILQFFLSLLLNLFFFLTISHILLFLTLCPQDYSRLLKTINYFYLFFDEHRTSTKKQLIFYEIVPTNTLSSGIVKLLLLRLLDEMEYKMKK